LVTVSGRREIVATEHTPHVLLVLVADEEREQRDALDVRLHRRLHLSLLEARVAFLLHAQGAVAERSFGRGVNAMCDSVILCNHHDGTSTLLSPCT
jgi:hypothetical protein